MKSKDIALIIIVAGFAAIFAFIVSRLFFVKPDNLTTQVEVVESMDPTFTIPDNRYFNGESINPTRTIQISENQNSNPFSASQ